MNKSGWLVTLIAIVVGFGVVLVLENNLGLHMREPWEIGIIIVVAMGVLLTLQGMRDD